MAFAQPPLMRCSLIVPKYFGMTLALVEIVLQNIVLLFKVEYFHWLKLTERRHAIWSL